MSSRIRWAAAAALLIVCIALVVVLSGRKPEEVVRAPDLPPSNPALIRQVLKLAQSTIDFGEIALGEKKTLSVDVENTGPRPILVYKVVIACPCLTAAIEPNTIAPGQIAKLNVVF